MPTFVDAVVAGIAAPLVAIVTALLRHMFLTTSREDTLKEAAGVVAFLDAWAKVPRTDERMKQEAETALHRELMRLLTMVGEYSIQRTSDATGVRRSRLLRTPRAPLAWVPLLLSYFFGALLVTVGVGAFRGARVEPYATAVWIAALSVGAGGCWWLAWVVEGRRKGGRFGSAPQGQ